MKDEVDATVLTEGEEGASCGWRQAVNVLASRKQFWRVMHFDLLKSAAQIGLFTTMA